jgi:predicted MFS family arabinose efflux permease
VHRSTYLLAAGAFAVGTSAYVTSGVLPDVAEQLDVSVAAAGQLSTAFALSYALGAPLLAVWAGRWERRTLLVVALAVAALGNLAAAVAPTYPLLIAARVVSALGAAAFTPGATVVATQLNVPQVRGRAVAAVYGGITLALVVGVPVGSLLGGPLGYRGVFALVGALCLLGAVGVRVLLPRVEAPPAVGLRERLAVAADSRVLAVLGISVVGLLAAMSVYTYAAPLLQTTAGVTGGVLSLLLLAYGAGALTGNALGGRLADRFGSARPLMVVLPLFTVTLALFPLAATTVPGAAVALFVLGGAGWATNAPIQSRLLALAPSGGPLLLSLNASAIYLGAGLSGAVGGLLIGLVGITVLPVVAAGLSVLSWVLLPVAMRERARGSVAA